MSSRRVYVGGVSSRTRERDLEDVFARYGRINNVDVKNGFAFVVRLQHSLLDPTALNSRQLFAF